MGRPASRSRLIAAAAGASLLTAGALGGIAVSAPQGPDGTIHACFNQAALDSDHASEIVLVNAGETCPAGWPQPIAWNAAGAAGQTGPKGEPGAEGKPGPKGDSGPKGDTGAEGKPGVKGEAGATPLPKQKEETILKQSKADDLKVKKADQEIDKIQDKIRNLDASDTRDLIVLQQQLTKWAQSYEMLLEIVRRLGQQQRDLIQGVK